ncbi:bifunctional diguanylate cyclase/phosphodiesterase [Paenibacillus sp.]|uniref:putative bifunctional diguanylate cyclase/phosphodiesterase n=1 Tax=Paenibacillus sp. TaxID=58172 RepID=UPI0028112E7A|nr:bifunctional diguanylate cyclase/phosphodiesterase [Paenibacillus sp.]
MYADNSVLLALDDEWSALLLEGDTICGVSGKALVLLDVEDRARVVGQPFARLLYQRITASLKEDIRESIESTGRWHGELKMRRGEDWFWAECAIRRLPSKNGEPRSLCCFRDSTRQKELEHQVFISECYDTLTSLPNRAFFGYRLSIEVDKASRIPSRTLLLLLIDIDHFKLINDSLGHAFGDRVLKEIAKRLDACIDHSMLLGRIGGDEFALVLKSESKPALLPKVRKVIEAVTTPIKIDQHDLSFTCSAGASCYPDDAKEADILLKHAELAMAAAKEQGRNQMLFFEKRMNASAMRRLLLPNYLRRAVERQEFEVYYQPKQRLCDLEIYGMEALIRWRSPDLGWVPPSEFITIAEELGLIHEIGTWVLRTACAKAREWQREGCRSMSVSVNLSGKQFQQQDLDATIAAVLAETGLPPERLELELTESSVMLHPEESAFALQRLKKLGVSVSVDDFGTGFSSLNYLSVFPLDTLKIDKSFVQAMTNDAKNAVLVEAIVDLGHKLGLAIVAEGVETPEQREMLSSYGCDCIQGYILSPPVDAASFKERYLRQG